VDLEVTRLCSFLGSEDTINPINQSLSEVLFGQPRDHVWKQPEQRQRLDGLLERHAESLQTMLRGSLTTGHVLDLAGIPNGYEVTVQSTWAVGLRVHVHAHSPLQVRKHILERSLQILEEGRVIINDYQNNQRPAEGMGKVAFAHQAAQAAAFGFQAISLKAARGSKMNGYYTWVRFGCNGELGSKRIRKLRRKFEQATGYELPAEVQTIHDLLDIEGGLELWREHGDTLWLSFDLGADSRCWAILKSYLESHNFAFAKGWITL
jgi:hypothetical protein